MGTVAKEDLAMTEYSPMRNGRKTLQDLSDLLPRMVEVDLELKKLHKALSNGAISWSPPIENLQ